MDEIEEVVLTLTPYEASVLRRLLDATTRMSALVRNERFPADQVILDITEALDGEGVPAATYGQCKSGYLDN